MKTKNKEETLMMYYPPFRPEDIMLLSYEESIKLKDDSICKILVSDIPAWKIKRLRDYLKTM